MPKLLLILCFLLATSSVALAQSQEALPSVGLDVAGFKQALPAENEPELDLDGFVKLRQEEGTVVLDVRSKEAFAYRHIKGAINIPLTELTEKTLVAAVPDKTKPILLICEYSMAPIRIISATMQAYPVLKSQGYSRIYRTNLWLRKNSQGAEGLIGIDKLKEHITFEGTDVPK